MTSSTTPNPNPCPAQAVPPTPAEVEALLDRAAVPPIAAIGPLLRVVPPTTGGSAMSESAR